MFKFSNSTTFMPTPHPYHLLFEQLRRWVVTKTQWFLQRFAAIVPAILPTHRFCLSQCLNQWLFCLCAQYGQDQLHLYRFSDSVSSEYMSAKTVYTPLLKTLLQTLQAERRKLTCDRGTTREPCYVMAANLLQGKDALAPSQSVLNHGSSTVGFEADRPALGREAKGLWLVSTNQRHYTTSAASFGKVASVSAPNSLVANFALQIATRVYSITKEFYEQ